jgi:hypothetical protein
VLVTRYSQVRSEARPQLPDPARRRSRRGRRAHEPGRLIRPVARRAPQHLNPIRIPRQPQKTCHDRNRHHPPVRSQTIGMALQVYRHYRENCVGFTHGFVDWDDRERRSSDGRRLRLAEVRLDVGMQIPESRTSVLVWPRTSRRIRRPAGTSETTPCQLPEHCRCSSGSRQAPCRSTWSPRSGHGVPPWPRTGRPKTEWLPLGLTGLASSF